MTGRYTYSVYGVDVVSDIPFELSPAADARGAASVTFSAGGAAVFDDAAAAMDADSGEFVFHELPRGAMYLRWPALYEFVVAADGTRVEYRPLDGCAASVLEYFLFGQVLAVAIVRQGIEPLHASVVDIGGEAIAFLGDCSFGKSTLLASFLERGHRVVTDDMLVVLRDGGEPHAMPGSGRIKLRPDSAARFLDMTETGTPLTPMTTKRSFTIRRERLRRSSLPLRTVFVLPTPDEREAAASIEIARLSPSDTARELLKNTFAIHPVDSGRLERQLDAATWLANALEGYKLRYPSGLQHLPEIRERVFEHARQLTAHCAS